MKIKPIEHRKRSVVVMTFCKSVYLIQHVNYWLGRLIQSMGRKRNEQRFELSTHSKHCYMRLSQSEMRILSSGIQHNAKYPAGMSYEISTDANGFGVRVLYKSHKMLSNMSLTATSGIDVFNWSGQRYEWCKCIAPKCPIQMLVYGTVESSASAGKYLVFLPPYAQIQSIYIEVPRQVRFSICEPNSEKTILFYGSSITQGCAASRPSLSYANLVGLAIGCRISNFGFSESAKGEMQVAEYIANRHADAYVLEYDHNATVDELRNTHMALYRTIRSRNAEAFIIFLSRFSGGYSISLEEAQTRQEIIESTYNTAISEGDRRVAFINGSTLSMNNARLLADDRHPNDSGMQLLAESIIEILRKQGY